jgi:hypothetical protein
MRLIEGGAGVCAPTTIAGAAMSAAVNSVAAANHGVFEERADVSITTEPAFSKHGNKYFHNT